MCMDPGSLRRIAVVSSIHRVSALPKPGLVFGATIGHGLSAVRRRNRACAVLGVLLWGTAGGCVSAGPVVPTSTTRGGRAFAWWTFDDVPPQHRTIIMLERRTRDGAAEQWLLAECGVRRINHTGAASRWGPPLAADDDDVRAAIDVALHVWLPAAGRTAPDADESAMVAPPASIPDLIAVLSERAGDLRVESPSTVTPAVMRAALCDAPIGIGELLALSASFK